MADIADILIKLAQQVAAIAYPNGTSAAPVTGCHVMIYPGWPVPNQLNADIAAGKAHISIFPRPDERNTTRYPATWQTGSINAATLTLMVTGNTVTVGGTVSTSQACMVHTSPNSAYSYQVHTGDTLDSIAAGLAALVPGSSSAGPVVTFPASSQLSAQVITTGTASKEVRRQERLVCLTIWAPSPATRDSITRAIDATLADTPRMTLDDQTVARLTYKGSPVTDMLEKSNIYRRDLLYSVEYATTITGTFYTVGHTNINSDFRR